MASSMSPGRDITDLMQAEKALQASELRYRSLVVATSLLDWVTDGSGKVVEDLPRWREFTGQSYEQVKGSGWLEAVHPDDRRAAWDSWASATATRSRYVKEFRVRRHDGEYRTMQVRGVPILEEDGSVREWVGSCTDITDLKRAEKVIQSSELRYRSLVVATTQLDWVTDSFGNVVEDLSRRREFTGQTFEQMKGLGWLDVIHPDDQEATRAAWAKAIATRTMFEAEYRIRRHDGEYRTVLSRGVPVFAEDGSVREWIGSCNDITERKKYEEELRNTNRQILALSRSNEALLRSTSEEQLLQDICKLAVEVGGYRMAWVGFAVHDEEKSIRPVAQEGFEEGYLAGLGLTWESGKARGEGPSGRCIRSGQPVIMNDARTDPSFVPWREEALKRGFASSLALPLVVEGQMEGILSVYAREPNGFTPKQVKLLTELANNLSYGIGALRAEAAREELVDKLREADRRKDEFLAMLAHELRNPLAAVTNAATVLKLTEQPRYTKSARDVIERQTHHLSHLIDDLLDASRITRGKIRLRKELIDAAVVLRHAIEVVDPLIKDRRHSLQTEIADAGLMLVADPTRLEQIVVNLLSNAAKYTQEGGCISLRAFEEEDQIVISVQDNGCGIPSEKISEMFQLFSQGDRTLARSEGGLGIGLTIVKSLVEMHGGTVSATSDGPGCGSTFTLRIPAASQSEADSAGVEDHSQSKQGGDKILVVEDNLDTAKSLEDILMLLGHKVSIAHDGYAAIKTAPGLKPDFVLLDIGLPGMDGYEVARRLRLEPSCQSSVIIAVTGYGQDEDRRRSQAAGFDHHLVKPLDFDKLTALLAPHP